MLLSSFLYLGVLISPLNVFSKKKYEWEKSKHQLP